jgi:hypothetical protein
MSAKKRPPWRSILKDRPAKGGHIPPCRRTAIWKKNRRPRLVGAVGKVRALRGPRQGEEARRRAMPEKDVGHTPEELLSLRFGEEAVVSAIGVAAAAIRALAFVVHRSVHLSCADSWNPSAAQTSCATLLGEACPDLTGDSHPSRVLRLQR